MIETSITNSGQRTGSAHAGRYVLGELLGRGGMAEVFAGYVNGSHGFQKPVAIKRLLPELATDHMFVGRLIAEAKLLVGVQHGNIVSVLDLVRNEQDVFLVMEYVDGPSLRQLLKARKDRYLLPLGVSTYIVQAAAAGLEYAHVQPGGAVIHADVSPSNILLTTSGEVRVADFGIARREGNANFPVEGKWAYMAPEQTRGEPLTPSSDVFSLGIVLYELITGRHPLGAATAIERISGPLHITPPSVVNPQVPRGLEALCMRALADDARDRFPRMQQMIDALVDERFTNQWRDSAHDLARAIRDSTKGRHGPTPTIVTEAPVTLMTRSLIVSPNMLDFSEAQSNDALTAFVERPSATPQPLVTPQPSSLTPHPGVMARGSEPAFPDRPLPVAALHVPPIASQPAPFGSQPPAFRSPPAFPMQMLGTPPPYGAPSPFAALPSYSPAFVPRMLETREEPTYTSSSSARKWLLAVFPAAVVIGVLAAVFTRSHGTDASPSTKDTAKPNEVANVLIQASAAETPPTVQPTVAQPTVPPPAPGTADPPANIPLPTPPAVQPSAAPVTQTAPKSTPNESSAAKPVAKRTPKSGAERPRVRDSRVDPEIVPPPPSQGPGMLRINPVDPDSWAWADIDGDRQEVPGAKYKLTPARYTVKFTNKDGDFLMVCTVRLEANRTTSLNIDVENRRCGAR